MSEAEQGQPDYPFEVKYDKEIDPSSVTFRLQFSKLPEDKDRIESVVRDWAKKGMEEGFGGKFIDYLDDEPDEEDGGGFEWSDKDNSLEFFVDMGSAEDEALMELFSGLSGEKSLKEITIGSGYEW